MFRRFKPLMLLLAALIMLSGLARAEAETETEDLSLEGYVLILHTAAQEGDPGQRLSLARVSYVRSALQKAGAQVILLDGGDTLFAPEAGAEDADGDSAVDSAARLIDVMNAVGYDGLALRDGDTIRGDALESLKDAASFPFITADDGEGATQIIETASLRLGILSVEEAAPNETDEAAEIRIQAALTAAEALRGEGGCDAVIALYRVAEDEAGLKNVQTLCAAEGAPQIILLSGLDVTWPEGRWLENTLLSVCRDGLTDIGCVAIDPTYQSAAMIVDNSWFDETMTDPVIAALVGE